MASWEKTGRNWQRLRLTTKVNSLRSLSVVPGRERKVTFHVVFSFPNSDCRKIYLLLILFLPGTVAFLFVSFCVLRTSLGNGQIGENKSIAGQKRGLNSMCG